MEPHNDPQFPKAVLGPLFLVLLFGTFSASGKAPQKFRPPETAPIAKPPTVTHDPMAKAK